MQTIRPDIKDTFTEWFQKQNLKHFTANELIWYFGRVRNGVHNSEPSKSIWVNIVPTLRVLDMLRERVGKHVNISSSYRSLPYNKTVGGVADSQHVKFKATDITVAGMTPREVFRELEKMRDEGLFIGGLGLYPTFVHVDTRNSNATW